MQDVLQSNKSMKKLRVEKGKPQAKRPPTGSPGPGSKTKPSLNSRRSTADSLMSEAKKGVPNFPRKVRPLTELISGVEDFGLNRNL